VVQCYCRLATDLYIALHRVTQVGCLSPISLKLITTNLLADLIELRVAPISVAVILQSSQCYAAQ